jgi:hypothetical protein
LQDTKIKTYNRGHAFGVLTWKGVSTGVEKKITSVLKKEWHAYDPEYFKKFEDTTKYIKALPQPPAESIKPAPKLLKYRRMLPEFPVTEEDRQLYNETQQQKRLQAKLSKIRTKRRLYQERRDALRAQNQSSSSQQPSQ